MVKEAFDFIVKEWMCDKNLLYRTYSYERADECFTLEIYTSKDPIDGIYVLVDEFNISIKLIQRYTLSPNKFDEIYELMNDVHYLVERLEDELMAQKKFEADNPPQTAQIIEFKRS